MFLSFLICDNDFEKTFRMIVEKSGGYCKKCTTQISKQKINSNLVLNVPLTIFGGQFFLFHINIFNWSIHSMILK